MVKHYSTLLEHITVSTKTAVAVASATTASGVGSLLDWIPNDIGKIATLIGIVLSLVLIFTHSVRMYLDYRKFNVEIDILHTKRRKAEEGD